MFVIFDKKSGYVRVTCTENPIRAISFADNWQENYDIAHFPYIDFLRASEILMKVEQNKLKVIGNKDELRMRGMSYEYDNYKPLFEGE